jgi:hypothetical protein
VDNKEKIRPGLKKHERGIFDRLEGISGKSEGKIKQKEADDIFSKLKNITKKRKK